jgi:hypothetical protein
MTMTMMTTTTKVIQTTRKTREEHDLLLLRPGQGYLPLLLRLASRIGKKWRVVEGGWAAEQGAREPCVKARG